MNHRIALAAVFCSLLAGCASDDGATAARERPTEQDYVTGTRIPQKKKEGVSTISREEWERAREQASQPIKEPRY